MTHRYNANDKIAIEFTCRDFWEKENNAWKVRREELLSSTVRINGQTVGESAEDLADASAPYKLSGTWQAQSPISRAYEVCVVQFGNRIVATKITSTRFVHAEAVTGYGVFTANAFTAKQQIAAALLHKYCRPLRSCR